MCVYVAILLAREGMLQYFWHGRVNMDIGIFKRLSEVQSCGNCNTHTRSMYSFTRSVREKQSETKFVFKATLIFCKLHQWTPTIKSQMELTLSSVVVMVVFCIGFYTPSSFAIDDGSVGQRPAVRTMKATIRGERISIQHRQLGDDFHRSVAVYKNIPFAEPPIGDLRYAEPVPKTLDGEFDATGDCLLCLQAKNPIMFDDSEPLNFSEDCLYLDVLVPEPKVIYKMRLSCILKIERFWSYGKFKLLKREEQTYI